jgi:hypothetical protein
MSLPRDRFVVFVVLLGVPVSNPVIRTKPIGTTKAKMAQVTMAILDMVLVLEMEGVTKCLQP